MYKELELDCISICTLADTHLKLVKEAVDNGIKGIFLEKPISNNLKNARKIIDICKKNNVKLAIDHQRRFDPFYHSIRKFIDMNSLGKIQLVSVKYGGGIVNTGSHIFNSLEFLFGRVKNLTAEYSKNKSPNLSDPNLEVKVEFLDGKNAVLHALDLTNYGISEIDIFGMKGRLQINIITNQAIYYKISSEDFQDYKKLKKTRLPFSPSKYAFDISLGLENLIHSIKNNEEPLCNGIDGYKALELAIGSLLSAKTKKRKNIPLKNEDYSIKSK